MDSSWYHGLLKGVESQLSNPLKKSVTAAPSIGAVSEEVAKEAAKEAAKELGCNSEVIYGESPFPEPELERLVSSGVPAETAAILSNLELETISDGIRRGELCIAAFGSSVIRKRSLYLFGCGAAVPEDSKDSSEMMLAPIIRSWSRDSARDFYNALKRPESAPAPLEQDKGLDSLVSSLGSLTITNAEPTTNQEPLVPEFTVDRSTMAKVMGDMSDSFPRDVLFHVSVQDPKGSLCVRTRRLPPDDLNAAATECLISCASAICGTGASILLCGIFRIDASTYQLVVVTCHPEKSERPYPRPSQIVGTIRSLASMSVAHLGLGTVAKSSIYTGSAIVCSHSKNDCTYLPGVDQEFVELAMASVALSEMLAQPNYDENELQTLLQRILVLRCVPDAKKRKLTLEMQAYMTQLWYQSASKAGINLSPSKFLRRHSDIIDIIKVAERAKRVAKTRLDIGRKRTPPPAVPGTPVVPPPRTPEGDDAPGEEDAPEGEKAPPLLAPPPLAPPPLAPPPVPGGAPGAPGAPPPPPGGKPLGPRGTAPTLSAAFAKEVDMQNDKKSEATYWLVDKPSYTSTTSNWKKDLDQRFSTETGTKPKKLVSAKKAEGWEVATELASLNKLLLAWKKAKPWIDSVVEFINYTNDSESITKPENGVFDVSVKGATFMRGIAGIVKIMLTTDPPNKPKEFEEWKFKKERWFMRVDDIEKLRRDLHSLMYTYDKEKKEYLKNKGVWSNFEDVRRKREKSQLEKKPSVGFSLLEQGFLYNMMEEEEACENPTGANCNEGISLEKRFLVMESLLAIPTAVLPLKEDAAKVERAIALISSDSTRTILLQLMEIVAYYKYGTKNATVNFVPNIIMLAPDDKGTGIGARRKDPATRLESSVASFYAQVYWPEVDIEDGIGQRVNTAVEVLEKASEVDLANLKDEMGKANSEAADMYDVLIQIQDDKDRFWEDAFAERADRLLSKLDEDASNVGTIDDDLETLSNSIVFEEKYELIRVFHRIFKYLKEGIKLKRLNDEELERRKKAAQKRQNDADSRREKLSVAAAMIPPQELGGVLKKRGEDDPRKATDEDNPTNPFGGVLKKKKDEAGPSNPDGEDKQENPFGVKLKKKDEAGPSNTGEEDKSTNPFGVKLKKKDDAKSDNQGEEDEPTNPFGVKLRRTASTRARETAKELEAQYIDQRKREMTHACERMIDSNAPPLKDDRLEGAKSCRRDIGKIETVDALEAFEQNVWKAVFAHWEKVSDEYSTAVSNAKTMAIDFQTRAQHLILLLRRINASRLPADSGNALVAAADVVKEVNSIRRKLDQDPVDFEEVEILLDTISKKVDEFSKVEESVAGPPIADVPSGTDEGGVSNKSSVDRITSLRGVMGYDSSEDDEDDEDWDGVERKGMGTYEEQRSAQVRELMLKRQGNSLKQQNAITGVLGKEKDDGRSERKETVKVQLTEEELEAEKKAQKVKMLELLSKIHKKDASYSKPLDFKTVAFGSNAGETGEGGKAGDVVPEMNDMHSRFCKRVHSCIWERLVAERTQKLENFPKSKFRSETVSVLDIVDLFVDALRV